MIHNEELPIGFTMALAQNSNSLLEFSKMPKPMQDKIVEEAKQIETSQQMHNYVDNICKFQA